MDDAPLRRGLVLLALHAQYPMALMEAALQRQVLTLFGGQRRSLERALSYLAAKGYLTLTVDTVGGRTLRSYKITTDGIDLVDGTREDRGVIISRTGD